MSREKITEADKSFLFALALKNLNLIASELNEEQGSTIHALIQDAMLESPTSKEGQKLRFDAIREKVNGDSDFSKSFNFGKDLYNNKTIPTAIFFAKQVADSIEKYLTGTPEENDAIVETITSEMIIKLNELNYPTDYIQQCFTAYATIASRVRDNLEGQITHRKDEIVALAVGVRHPTYNTLDSRIVSFKDLDNAVVKLRESTGFKEEDYR